MGYDLPPCPEDAFSEFVKGVKAQLWRSNALMVGNVVLVTSMVVVSATGWRYRHSAVTRFISLVATTLFLPITSYVSSSIGSENCKAAGMKVDCQEHRYIFLLLMWTVLVQTIGINFSVIVAVDDGDGQKLGPSIELLARALWTSYLVFYYYSGYLTSRDLLGGLYPDIILGRLLGHSYFIDSFLSVSIIALSVLSLIKITHQFYAFEKARRSFALGRNARLVAGYMEQLHSQQLEDEPIPPLIVMGEEKQQIVEGPHGYTINRAITNNSLVTIDRIWRLASTGDILLVRQPQLKDLCLSLALFKLLRRRFARCHLAESGSTKAFNFVRGVMLSDGDPDRAFRVVAEEASFLGDSYYSSLPACNFGKLLPILNIMVSLFIISFCLAAGGITGIIFSFENIIPQLGCVFPCVVFNGSNYISFGSILFNSWPTLFLFVAAILAEAWEVASYICSNWLKVTLICSYVTHASWQQSPIMHRWLGLALKLRIRWIKSCSDKMGQISLLAHRQPKASGLRQMLSHFSDHGVQHVKVPSEVKAAIVESLISSNGSLSQGVVALQNTRIGNNVVWAIQGQSTTDVILVWHIATGIVEARHAASTGPSADRAVTTYISQYRVYLLKAAPELLPDDKAWSKKRYKAVSEEISQLLRDLNPKSMDYDKMIELLSKSSNHHDQVVDNGVRLGKQLVVEQQDDAEAVWGVLGKFWSEMILYVAPSDNLKAHKESIARGGELLTLVWMLLTNAGIITRPGIRTAA